MSQLLLAYWISTGIGFAFIVGSSLMGHFHGSEDVEAGGDPGDVDGGDPGDVDSGDPGDVDGGSDTDYNDPGDVDSGDPGDVDGGSEKMALAKDATSGAIGGKHNNRSLRLYLKLVGFFSPTKLALFFFFFGAMGVITLHLFPFIGHLSLIPAVLFGYAFGRILLNLLSSLVGRMHSSTNFKQDSLIGSVGELNLSIEPGRTGEITVSTRGSRHSGPARATDPSASIKNLSKVMISDYRDGVFYVEPASPDNE